MNSFLFQPVRRHKLSVLSSSMISSLGEEGTDGQGFSFIACSFSFPLCSRGILRPVTVTLLELHLFCWFLIKRYYAFASPTKISFCTVDG